MSNAKRRLGATLSLVGLLLMLMPLVAPVASAVDPVPDAVVDHIEGPSPTGTNHVGFWNAYPFPHPRVCFKHEANGGASTSDHGSSTGSTVTLNTFNPDWPGDHWEALIIKAGTKNNVYIHPTAGVAYGAPEGKTVSHWIVCKGTGPVTTTTVDDETTTTAGDTTTTAGDTTTTVGETTTTVGETTTTIGETTTTVGETTTTVGETTTTAGETTTTQATTTTTDGLIEVTWNASAVCDEITATWGSEGIVQINVFMLGGIPGVEGVSEIEVDPFLEPGTKVTGSNATFTLVPVTLEGYVAIPEEASLFTSRCVSPTSSSVPTTVPTTGPTVTTLPFTGIDSNLIVGLGLSALALGALLIFLGTRREEEA